MIKMDQHLVLATFYTLAEQLKNERKRSLESHKSEARNTTVPPNISGSGRNLLCALLNHGEINQRNLAKILNISSQAVSETIKKLETLEYIEKISGTQNNENIIVLTPIGKTFAIECDRRIREHASIVFEHLSEEELTSFYELLVKLLDV